MSNREKIYHQLVGYAEALLSLKSLGQMGLGTKRLLIRVFRERLGGGSLRGRSLGVWQCPEEAGSQRFVSPKPLSE